MLALVAAGARGSETVLFDFGPGFDPAKAGTSDTKVSVPKPGTLRVESGHTNEWPGVTLKAPAGSWDLATRDWVAVDVANTGAAEISVSLRVDSGESDGNKNCNYGNLSLKPGEKGVLKAAFARRERVKGKGIELFAMRAWPGSVNGRIDPSRVTQLIVYQDHPSVDHAYELSNIRAGGSWTIPQGPEMDPATFFPFIDTYGQYLHRDWPGKTHGVVDLALRIKEEDADLAAHPAPADRDKWGGWVAGPALKPTGFFRPVNHEGKWWLVDPDGRLFWSYGIDCVGEGDSTPVDDRAAWFKDLPPKEGPFAEFYYQAWNVLNDHYKGKRPWCFNFRGANCLRKWGPEWYKRAADMAHRRLASWGLNTIANWSDEGIYLMRRTPYCVSVWFEAPDMEGSEGYWGKFHDVFDPGFRAGVRKGMEYQKGKSAGDPWCLGYFVDNEIAWGDTPTTLAEGALASPAAQPAKKAFIGDLRKKYGTIAKLNAAWGTAHGSWDALLKARKPPAGDKAKADLEAFTLRIADEYFRVIREEVKRVAPDNLYLGCRFAWVNPVAEMAATRYCDVVSYNRYDRDARGLAGPAGADVPLIIGEFHFGALDRGMFHTGLVPVRDQAERAEAFKAYVTGALAHPALVGCHWFKYGDEPTTGRELDGENYQIGFIDVCGTPYPETVAAAREIGKALYGLRAGARP